jgi:hypothetical protein
MDGRHIKLKLWTHGMLKQQPPNMACSWITCLNSERKRKTLSTLSRRSCLFSNLNTNSQTLSQWANSSLTSLLHSLLFHTTRATAAWHFAQHFSYSTRSFCKYLKLGELSKNVVSRLRAC